MTTNTHYRACHLCEAICGLVIETEGEKVLSIKGDKADPLSRGHICPKAIALSDIHTDPDRLRQPLKRSVDANGEASWQEISWPEALDTCAAKLVEISARQGVDAIGIYMGNPTVHNYGMMTHQSQLFSHFRTNNRFSATSVDQLPHHLAAYWLFGHKTLFPIPDIDRSDYFLMLGANPLASNGSIWTVPDVRKRLTDMTKRGGKVVLIDPRRTETAAFATEHHFIRPGTDVLFLLALLNTLFKEGLVDTGHLSAFVSGLDQVAEAIVDFTPAYAERHTSIAASSIEHIARDLAAAPAAICYGRMGVSVQAFGGLNQWLIQLINIATGNLDKAGGSMFTLPAIDQVANIGVGGFARHHSRVRALPEFDRELPVSTLAEEILTEGEGQIRALITAAGNPVLSTPNGRQLDRALASLEFVMSLDPYLNETTRHADIILPPTSPLEHDHYDLAFHVNAIRNTSRHNEAIFDKPEGALHDWEIFTELGNRVAVLLDKEPQPAVPPDQIIAMGLQIGPYGDNSKHRLSLDKLRAAPSGIDLGPLKPLLPERLRTADKRIQCATPEPLADLARVRATFDAAAADAEQSRSSNSSSNRFPSVEAQPNNVQSNNHALQLIGRRHVRSNNSWMHNFHRLVKGRNRCTLLMHPQDMAKCAVSDGSEATVTSRAGTVQVKVEASEDIMPGVVSLPHGFGHHRAGVRMAIASANAGESCNDLTDELVLDQLSGNAALNGVAVTVVAVHS